ncbi:hypothetical protein SH661x_001121 [Planctomicrobium sp. SH661]|uniref:hypothetical protein n=1 Tax=Planctomicrobium sp. SH661 TaxID=3448124 RepID=UPI003F5C02C3
MPKVWLRVVCTIVLSLTATVRAEPPLRVGIHGDLSTLVVRGSKNFTTQQVRRAIRTEPTLFLNRQPDRLMALFIEKIQSQLMSGVEQAGFLDAKVQVNWSEEDAGIAVEINEGPRYLWHELRVTCENETAQAAVEDWLTRGKVAEIHPASNHIQRRGAPDFEAGEPASGLEETRKSHLKLVREALESQGFDRPRIEVDFRKLPESGHIDVEIQVQDLGTPRVADEIKVQGNERQSVQKIIELAGISPGSVVTQNEIAAAVQRLWQSGRFRQSSIELEPRGAFNSQRTLRISVQEYADAPLLEEPLSPEQEIMIRAANWFNSNSDVDGQQLRMSLEFPAVVNDEAFLLKKEELLLASQFQQFRLQTHPNGSLPEMDVIIRSDQEFLWCSAPQYGVTLRIPVADCCEPNWHVLADGVSGPIENGGRIQLIASVGRRTKGSGTSDFNRVLISPMAALFLLRKDFSKAVLVNGKLEQKSPSVTLSIDAATGKLNRFEAEDEGFRFEIAVENEHPQPWMSPETEGHRLLTVNSLADIATVLENLGSFLAAANPADKLEWDRCRLAMRIASRWAAHVQSRGNAEKTEHINLGGGGWEWIHFGVIRLLAARAQLVCLEYLPADSLPSRAYTDLLLVELGKDLDAKKRLEAALESPDCGPLLSLYLSVGVSLIRTDLANSIAKLGQGRLDDERFERDLDQFLLPGSDLAAVLEGFVRSVRECGEADLRALLSGIATEEEISEIDGKMEDPAVTDLQLGRVLLTCGWSHGGKQVIGRALKKMSGNGPELLQTWIPQLL